MFQMLNWKEKRWIYSYVVWQFNFPLSKYDKHILKTCVCVTHSPPNYHICNLDDPVETSDQYVIRWNVKVGYIPH